MNNVVLNDVKDIHQLFKSSHYAVKEKIGEGGFGQVYLADQINTGQKVAIKFLLLNQHLTENKRQRYIARFNRETAHLHPEDAESAFVKRCIQRRR